MANQASESTDVPYRVEVPERGYWRRQIRCQDACPVHTDARGYVRAIAEGDYRRAYRIARGPNPLASICGRICGAPCEAACRRGAIDAPIAIRALKRFACERYGVESGTGHPAATVEEATARAGPELENASREEIRLLLDSIKSEPFREPSGPRIAIIGSGPAGLAAAHDLALLGFQPVVYEMEPIAAGMLYLGVPEYRLPRLLISGEIDAIQALGVRFRLGVTVGKDVSLADLRRDHGAVVIAVGAKRSRGLPLENADAPGVVGGVEFLRSVALREPLPLGRKVIVIGGGNVAYDVARTVLRQESYDVAITARRRPGVEEVHLCALESLEEMPADQAEIEEGDAEGISRHNSIGPHEILVDDEGLFTGITFKKCLRVYDDQKRFHPVFDESELSTLEGDTLLLSVGQQIRFDFIDAERDGIRLTDHGFVEVDPETGQSRTAPDVFVAGDCAHGPRLAIDAIASGKKAARAVHTHLSGPQLSPEVLENHSVIADYGRETDYEKVPRIRIPTLSPSERRVSLSKAVELPLTESAAEREASRCLDCGVNTIFDGERCVLCGGCVDVCPTCCLNLVPLAALGGGDDMEGLRERYLTEGSTEGLSAIIKDEERCIRCGLCAERCPTGAVTMERFLFREVLVAREAHTA
jgi:NADPH-dependent glutamate synthase beta subunit-like oxidoreductase